MATAAAWRAAVFYFIGVDVTAFSLNRLGSNVAGLISLPKLIEAVLIIGLAYLTVQLIWQLITPISTPSVSGEFERVQAAGSVASYDAIRRFDPFHRRSVVSATTAEAFEAVAKETDLDLDLMGVRLAAESQTAVAFVKLPNGLEQTYVPSQQILDGVRLETVLFDRIVLNRNGALETLSFPGRGNRRTQTRAEPSVAVVDRRPSVAAFMAGVDIKPRREGAGLTGFVLTPNDDGEIFAQLNLQPGDVLVALDGQRLDRLDQLTGLADRLGTNSSVQALIERNGRPVPLVLSFSP